MTTGAPGGTDVPPGTDPVDPTGAPPPAPASVRPGGATGWPARVAAGTVLAVVLAVVGLLWLGERPTVRLDAVVPGTEAVLATAPTEITLLFAAPPRPVEQHVSLVGPDGRVVAAGTSRVEGSRIVLPLTGTATVNGTYTVGYHLRFSDGRELSGQSRYTLDPAAPPRPGGTPTPQADAGHAHGGPDGWNLALLGLDLVLILVVLAVMLPRRRPRRP